MPNHKPRFLSGTKVHFIERSIRLAGRRLKIWKEKLLLAGGEILQDPTSKEIDVVLLGDLEVGFDTHLPSAPLASVKWLEACLAKQKLLPVKDFIVTPPRRALSDKDQPLKNSDSKGNGDLPQPLPGPLRKFERWLGFWEPELDHINNVTELMLQAKFSAENSTNEALVERLVELHKFECAVLAEHSADAESDGGEGINHNALQYARAAAVARACAFRIGPDLQGGDLPFIGPASAKSMREILSTGSCSELEAFRAGELVHNSRGAPRPETRGGDVRKLFKKLPGAGVASAQAWWEAGFKSFEAVLAHAEDAAAAGTRSLVSKVQLFSLRHREDLLEACPLKDIEEMREAVAEALQSLTGSEWRLWSVGGARRGTASHDADFVASHSNSSVEGVVSRLLERLTAGGRMVAQADGMCLVQQGRLLAEALRKSPTEGAGSNLRSDRYDRIVGIFITAEGRYRRLDVILPPWDLVPFCLLSWTGSKQHSRFLRQHAQARGMVLNAHSLMREVMGEWCFIPEEAPPLDRSGNEFWPPGWDSGRKVCSEADIFELLQVPYREPQDRNCP